MLAHRLILRPESRLRKVSPASVLGEILPDVAVPILASQQAEAEGLLA